MSVSRFSVRRTMMDSGRLGFAVIETVEAREKRVLSETEAYFNQARA